MTTAAFIPPSEIRARFSEKMSQMYREEVPLYGKLLDIVTEINEKYLEKHSELAETFGDIDRITQERHGAIRLGKPQELATMRQLFEVMGMYPVGYYDLSVRNFPVHATAFRPIEEEELNKNPFRIFTSLLRTDLLQLGDDLKDKIKATLNDRDIFTPRVRELIGLYQTQGKKLTAEQAEEFIDQALETFRWHKEANVEEAFYNTLVNIDQLLADIVCFKGPHINHLTPRVLDIDALHAKMHKKKIATIEVIQGPPHREIPILLRQTSFRALVEDVTFLDKVKGNHQARFGEIESRGYALTAKGRKEYDKLLKATETAAAIVGSQGEGYSIEQPKILKEMFKEFPDDLPTLRQEGLMHFKYQPTEKGKQTRFSEENYNIERLISEGYIVASPLTYEDFLPVSAAGIFTSNLGKKQDQALQAPEKGSQDIFEKALGAKVLDPAALYAAQEASSIKDTFTTLGIKLSHVQEQALQEVMSVSAKARGQIAM